MKGIPTRLIIRAWLELALHDAVTALGGFRSIQRLIERQRFRSTCPGLSVEIICSAVDVAACFYFKRIRCLQRSAAAVRLLRRNGIAAGIVIGQRGSPHGMHAWAEVDGRIVNDSPAYASRLSVIYPQGPKHQEGK